ncbi:MAG: Na+/H+ antiporter NhaC family protein [Phycisphaerae bacterium]
MKPLTRFSLHHSKLTGRLSGFLYLLPLILVGALALGFSLQDNTVSSEEPIARESATGSANDGRPAVDQPTGGGLTPTSGPAPAATPATYYDLAVLLPAFAAIVIAIAMRQVIPALLIGILIAAFMIRPFESGTMQPGGAPEALVPYIVNSIRKGFEGYLVGAFTGDDGTNHTLVVLFTLTIGGMVGVIEASGGTRAVVNAMARFASDRRGGQTTAWFSGLFVFFDDYANCMIVGPTMRPVFDRLRISREKLAYIVDSTAAPVSSILIGTWLATEISMIDEGLGKLGAAERPSFLQGATGFTIFWASIPYRYYALLAIIMVFLVSWTRRDFGPMLKAEREAYTNPVIPEDLALQTVQPVGRAWYAIVPIAVIVVGVVSLLFLTGWTPGNAALRDAVAAGQYSPTNGSEAFLASVAENGRATGTVYSFSWRDRLEQLIMVLGNCDTYVSLLYAALAALLAGVIINLSTGAANVRATFEGMNDGIARVFPALIVLALAWALSAGTEDLQVGAVAEEYLKNRLQFDARWLPLATFVSAAVVSFATGTSWGTMTILCPIAVTLGARLTMGMDADPTSSLEAHDIFYATVGAVLVGAVFGDHCSPISDTTVLSSMASGCTLDAHVWTQMPYALVTAGTSILVGDFLLREFNQPWWVGLIGGTVLLWIILMIFGRRVETMREKPVAERASIS